MTSGQKYAHPILKLNDADLAVVIRLLRAADVAFGNREGSLFDVPDSASSLGQTIQIARC